MDTSVNINRVAHDIAAWRPREEQFMTLFPAGELKNTAAFLKEKLLYFEDVASRYYHDISYEERATLSILAQVTKSLERLAYPSALNRFFRSLVKPFRQRARLADDFRRAAGNRDELLDSVAKLGFPGIGPMLEQQLKFGRPSFNLPVSYFMNDSEILFYNLNFTRQADGRYTFDNYRAKLRTKQSDVLVREQNFPVSEGHTFSARQAYNLVAGRSVQVEYLGTDNQWHKGWQQLDFNDKDATGNYPLRMFRSEETFDFRKTIAELNISELHQAEGINKVYQGLADGNLEKVTLIQDGQEKKAYLQIEPAGRSYSLYDLDRSSTSLSRLFEKQVVTGVSAAQPAKSKTKVRNNHAIRA